MKCPKCSKEIDDNSVFCSYCGEELNDNNTYYPLNKEETNTTTPIKIVRLFFMWIMIIIAVSFFFIALSQDYSTALKNEENFWYGQYVTTAIFHALCGLFFLKIAQLLYK